LISRPANRENPLTQFFQIIDGYARFLRERNKNKRRETEAEDVGAASRPLFISILIGIEYLRREADFILGVVKIFIIVVLEI
jgi:hypothetical protein